MRGLILAAWSSLCIEFADLRLWQSERWRLRSKRAERRLAELYSPVDTDGLAPEADVTGRQV